MTRIYPRQLKLRFLCALLSTPAAWSDAQALFCWLQSQEAEFVDWLWRLAERPHWAFLGEALQALQAEPARQVNQQLATQIAHLLQQNLYALYLDTGYRPQHSADNAAWGLWVKYQQKLLGGRFRSGELFAAELMALHHTLDFCEQVPGSHPVFQVYLDHAGLVERLESTLNAKDPWQRHVEPRFAELWLSLIERCLQQNLYFSWVPRENRDMARADTYTVALLGARNQGYDLSLIEDQVSDLPFYIPPRGPEFY